MQGSGEGQIGIRVVVLGVNAARQAAREAQAAFDGVNGAVGRAAASSLTLDQRLARLGSTISTLGRNLTFSLTLPLTALNAALIASGIAFEDAFAGVGKTVEGVTTGFDDVAKSMYGTAEGLSQVQKDAVFASGKLGELTSDGLELRNAFRDLALEIPISVNELARIGQVAGQLGVGKDEIKEFTRIVSLLTVTTDLAAEDAAFALARIGNIMGVATSDLDDFAKAAGASIVALGNTAAATEPEIVNLAMRMAAAGRLVGLTTPEILGLSATLAELGVRAERGGTAVSRVVYEMLEAATVAGSETAAIFAEILGVDTETFKRRFREDAIGTIKDFLQSLTNLQEQGKITGDQLTELGLSGVRVREVVNLLGPNMALLSENIALSNDQWVKQIALEEEAAKRFRTVKSQLVLLKNAFVDLGISIFDAIAPDIQKVIALIGKAISAFNGLEESTKRWIVRISLAVAAIGPLLIAFGSLLQMLAFSMKGFRVFGASFAGLFAAPALFTKVQSGLKGTISKLLGVFTNPFKVIFAGLGGAILNPIKDAVTSIGLLFKGTLLPGISSVASRIGGFFKNLVLFVPRLLQAVIGGFISGFLNTLKLVTLAFQPVILLVKGAVQGILTFFKPFVSFLTGTVRILGNAVFGILGGIGKVALAIPGRLLSFLPGLAKGLLGGLAGIVAKIPLILAGIGVAFTLLFAPKVISQAIKNWDSVLESLKTSFTAFVGDLKTEGLSKALLLLTSGGSLGSGRESGVLGIAKALGASEENARRFSYALGTATFWAIKLVSSIGTLVDRIKEAFGASSGLSKSLGSTSERIISLMTTVAEFLEGFFTGWTGSFDGIVNAVTSLGGAFTTTMNEIGRMFDAIFGRATKKVDDFYDRLEPGTNSGITRAGETIGMIVGKILEYAIRGIELVALVVGKVAGAIADLVTAYNQGGIEGLLTELGNKLTGVWDALILGLTLFWENSIKPLLEDAITKAANWLKGPGKDLLVDAANALWGAFTSVADTILFGKSFTTKNPIQEEVSSLISYTSKEGDSLRTVAKQYGTSVNAIRAANNQLFEGDYLWPGTSLMVPVTRTIDTSATEEVTFPGILPSIQKLIQDIYAFLSSEDTKSKVKEGLKLALDKLIEAVTELWAKLKPYFDSFLTDVRNWLNTNAPIFKSIGEDIGNAIKNGVADALTPDWLVEFILPSKDVKTTSGQGSADATLMASVMAEATNFGPLLNKALAGTKLNQSEIDGILQGIRNLGQDIPESLEEGLRNGSLTQEDRIYLIGVQIANTLTRGTKDGVGANSPSTVFRQIGSDVIAGLAMGISYNLPNLNSIVSAMVNIFFQAANQITNAMNSIRMQVFQIQGYMQTVQKAQMTTQLAYQQAQQQAAVAAAQQAAQVAGQIGGALTGFNPMFPPVNQIILNTQPAGTTTTTTNLNTNVTGIPITSIDDAAYVIDRTLRTVKAGHTITR